MRASGSKLSPWPYIRNNRVRSTVLIISLSMFMVMIYLMNYIIGGTDEPFYQSGVAPYERIRIAGCTLDLDRTLYTNDEDFLAEGWKRAGDCCDKIKMEAGILDAKPFAFQYVQLKSFIGMSSLGCFLFESPGDCEDYLHHMDAKLLSGRMPEKPGEVLMEKKLIDNHKNDGALLQLMGSKYEIVGEVESEYYLAFGMALPGENNICEMFFVENGSEVDGKALCEKHGYKVSFYEEPVVMKQQQKEMMGSLDIVQTIFTGVSGGLLLICVSVVLALHILDRHNEWCLLNSIGFSSGEIYLMALKELLICLAISILVGGVLSYGLAFLMEHLMYRPIGISIRVWRPAALPRIFIVFGVLIGIAQIPIFSGMRKIQTIDAIES